MKSSGETTADILDAPGPPLSKFADPWITAEGQPRARVALERLQTLWFNTGTLCNLTCHHCYIESSPRNDRLVYLTRKEVEVFLDEIDEKALGTEEIGLTGGEPFMNPELIDILRLCLERGYRVLLLTNAMRPMMKQAEGLKSLRAFGDRLTLRVSLDHYSALVHEAERGARSWQPTVAGLQWLKQEGFCIAVAGRRLSGESEAELRAGYQQLFTDLGLALDAQDPAQLVLFPEMDAAADVPEITEACWGILGKSPRDVMCASSRMVVKRKGAEKPVVVACTLLPYQPAFELGQSLKEASGEVSLNHPHCARFCVLGGASCSAR